LQNDNLTLLIALRVTETP